jgi:hypothetical protein
VPGERVRAAHVEDADSRHVVEGVGHLPVGTTFSTDRRVAAVPRKRVRSTVRTAPFRVRASRGEDGSDGVRHPPCRPRERRRR